jgi:HTH-type transcriptional regulator/antitoxin HigA
MTVKPIRNPIEYQAAKDKLKIWIAANKDGAKSDDIEVLVAVLEQYERQKFPVNAPSPVAAIKYRMQQKGMLPRDLEPFIGSRARVSEVLAGKRSLSLDHIRALHEGLSIPYEALIEKPTIKQSEQIEVSRPILKRLASMGFELKPENVTDFLHRAFGHQTSPALLARRTRTQRASAKTDEAALLLWQAAALIKAAKNDVATPFKPSKLTDEVLRQVAQLSATPGGPKNVKQFLAKQGIVFVINPTLPGTFLDGAAMLLNEKTPVLVLTIRHDRVDNFWFTLLHELVHISRHYEALREDRFAFFDDLDLDSEDIREQEADELAQECLIPSALLRSVNWSAYSSNEDITKLAGAAHVDISIVAGRWQRHHADYRKFSRLIERNTLREMLAPNLFSD